MRSALLAVLVGLVAGVPGAAYGIGGAEHRGAGVPPPNPLDQAPAWSADGKRVVFSSWRLGENLGVALASVSVDGSDERVIAVGWPLALSPDGQWIADGSTARRVDGTETRSLGVYGEQPVWSPDSRRVALLTYNDGLWVVDRDGSGLVQLDPNGRAPAWSPDGEWIAYERRGSGNSPGDADLMIVNSSGGVPQALVEAPGHQFQPMWSSDGTLIAFLAQGATIHVVRPDGSGLRGFSNAISDGNSFAWMPDSRRLAFASKGIVLLDVSSGRVDRVNKLGDSPSPSPDGSRIAFAAPTCGRQVGIHVVGVDGRGLRRLTNGCSLVGTSGPDELHGHWWHQVVRGLGGDDRLYGGTWNLADVQSLYGGAGDDVLVGSGQDRLDGGPGDDELRGHSGEDRLVGGPGRDYLFGGRGRDRVFARDGERDIVSCGSKAATTGPDRVWADRVDYVSRDCELVFRPAGRRTP